MRIAIFGASGFVGSNLCNYLLAKGHSITGFSRHRPKNVEHSQFSFIKADPTLPGPWQKEIIDHDAIINLAGQSVFHYWTKAYKKVIKDSRVQSTRNIVEAISDTDNPILFNASAVGYYGDQGDNELPETAPNGTDFLATVCREWEDTALNASSKCSRILLGRFGIVLGANGGALSQMHKAFKLYLGGPIGNGEQWMPWIHIDDLTAAIEHLLLNTSADGPVNFCAPTPTTNRIFSQALASILHRPCWLPAPAFLLKLLLGEFSNCLLCSQKVIPNQLKTSGFLFQYPTIHKVFTNLLS